MARESSPCKFALMCRFASPVRRWCKPDKWGYFAISWHEMAVDIVPNPLVEGEKGRLVPKSPSAGRQPRPRRTGEKGPAPALTADQFWNELRLVSTEIEDSVVLFHTYEELNRLALSDENILMALNRDALFWNTYRHSLLTSLFITLGRIFDKDSDAHSIHRLLAAVTRNRHLFSAQSLRERRIEQNGGQKPDWLDEFMTGTWEPKEAGHLAHFKPAIKPHEKRFREIYAPIRHSIFAHRLMSNFEANHELFRSTNREDLGVMLDFLHDLIECITHLFMNGAEPKLGTRDFQEYNQRVRDGVGTVLERLL